MVENFPLAGSMDCLDGNLDTLDGLLTTCGESLKALVVFTTFPVDWKNSFSAGKVPLCELSDDFKSSGFLEGCPKIGLKESKESPNFLENFPLTSEVFTISFDLSLFPKMGLNESKDLVGLSENLPVLED